TMVISEIGRRLMLKVRDAVTEWLANLKVTPNALTLTGMVINFLAGWSFALGKNIQAALLIIFAGAFDILDGAVAKQRNMVTKFGAFFDSTIDRYSDLFLFGGIIIYFIRINKPLFVAFGISSLIASQLVSYTRARAESLTSECKVGFWERPERTVYLLIGAFANNLATVIMIEAFLIHTTAIQRILYARAKLSDNKKKPALIYRLIFWDFQRYTLTYDIMVAILASLPFFIRPL
ncbi:MAG: CDP-alcohol phosphatidyltransferase family protein, partial [Candidatus Omnitrophota bacterium]